MPFVRGHHGIYIPITKEVTGPERTIGIAGYITVELIDAKTQRTRKRLQFKNLITNLGLDNMRANKLADSSTSLTKYCAVGTGSTAPANTDTTLVAEISTRATMVASPGPIYSYVAGPPDYHKSVAQYLFLETQANGNLTEVGFFFDPTAGSMFSRQLFKDDLGTPTTIVKTSSDQLRITYEIRVYPAATDTVLSAVDISGTVVDVTTRALGVSTTQWNQIFTISGISDFFNSSVYARIGALPARTSNIVPSSISGSSPGVVTTAAYVSGDYHLDRTHKWEPANGTGNILCVAPNTYVVCGVGFSAAIAKTSANRFTLNTRVSWARV